MMTQGRGNTGRIRQRLAEIERTRAMLQITDRNGITHDAAWLAATYGARVVPGPSGRAFRLVRVAETEGPATVMAHVQEAGAALAGHGVALSWPDAPEDLTTPEARLFVTRYRPRAAVQWTNASGDTGFGLGGGSYIKDLAVGGPHACWVLHNIYASDVLDGIGMLGGTNHRGPLRMVFELAEAERLPWYKRLWAWVKRLFGG